MSWRTIIISNQAKLDYKMGYLVIRGIETKRVLVDEISILLIENPAVSLTGCLLEILTERKVKVIFCDSKRLPCSELIPHHGNMLINNKPPNGLVQSLVVTENQFSKMRFISGEWHSDVIDNTDRVVVL